MAQRFRTKRGIAMSLVADQVEHCETVAIGDNRLAVT